MDVFWMEGPNERRGLPQLTSAEVGDGEMGPGPRQADKMKKMRIKGQTESSNLFSFLFVPTWPDGTQESSPLLIGCH